MIGRTNIGGGGGSSEVHGASIAITTEQTTLIGKTCYLKFGNKVVDTKVFASSGICIFIDTLQEVGTYTVYANDGTKSKSETVIVTGEDIVNKNILELKLNFYPDLPIASKGEVIQIGGKNCMCIGTNRYIYMYNIGSQNWDSAMSAAQNWSVPTEISSLYDVSSIALMNYWEANALAYEQRASICTTTGVSRAWLSTTSTETRAYLIDSGGNLSDVGRNFVNGCLPAFTISHKY